MRKTKEQKQVEQLVDDLEDVRKKHANLTHATYIGTLAILLMELLFERDEADKPYS